MADIRASSQETRMSFKSSNLRPLSKIGLLEESFDAPCAILPRKESYAFQTIPLQTLDASVLLRNCSNQAALNSSCNKSAKSCLNSGLDNNGFTFECIENNAAGSRKPVIAVDYRTISNEQLVVSRFCNSSANVLSRSRASITCEGESSNNFDIAETQLSAESPSQSCDRVVSGNKVLLTRVGTPRPRGKLRRERPLHMPVRTFNEIKYNHRTACFPWNGDVDAIRLRLNSYILNTDFITDSDSSDGSSTDEMGNSAVQPSSNTSDCSQQKIDFVTREKTERGGSQWRKPVHTVSLPRDMVQVGCASRLPTGHYTNNISVSPNGPYVSNVNTVSVSASVSIRNNALISPVRSLGKFSNVRGSSTITTTPTVSALTKVSSVRIVPTPTPTPTPSVTGNSENGSTKLAPPPQRAPFKQNLQDSLSPLAIARPEPRPLETVASSVNIRSTQPSAVAPAAVACNPQHNANCNSQASVIPENVSSNHIQVSPQKASTVETTHSAQAHSHQSSRNRNTQQDATILVSNHSSPPQHQSTNTQSSPLTTTQPQNQVSSTSLPPHGSSRNNAQVTSESDAAQRDIDARRGDRERRRERRERRRERRAQRLSGALLLPPPPLLGPVQTDISGDNVSTNPNPPNARLPDLLNSHVPPPYSTLPNGARTHGGLLPPTHPPGPLPPGPIPPGVPPPLPIHLQHHPPGAPIPPGYPPPPTPGSPIRPPPDCPWPFFGSRR